MTKRDAGPLILCKPAMMKGPSASCKNKIVLLSKYNSFRNILI